MHDVLTWRFRTTGGSDYTSVTINETNIVIGGVSVDRALLGDIRDAIRQLLDQPRDDGEMDTAKQVTGGPLISASFPSLADNAQDTIVLYGVTYSRSKIDTGFLGGLVKYDLLPPLA